MKNLDFMKVEKQKDKQEAARRRGRTILSLLPLVLMLVYLQSYIYYMEKTDEMGRQILEIQSVLENQEMREEEDRLGKLQKNTEVLIRYKAQEESLSAAAKERAVLTSEVLKTVETVMEDRVELVWDDSYPVHYESGILTFTAQTRNPLEASKYIERLKADDGFEDVEYHGFERKSETEGEGEELYLFEVNCRLALPETSKKEARNEKIIKT